LIAGGASFFLGPHVAAYFKNPSLLQLRSVQAVYVACLLGAFPLEISLTSQGRTRQAAMAYLVSDTVRALMTVVPILLGFGLLGMMTALAGFAALRYSATWLVLLHGSEGPLFDTRRFIKQLMYAAPFGAAMALSIPQQYAHQYVVSGAVSPALFALYAVGCFQLPVVDLLYTPTSEVLMVQLGELDKEGRMAEAVQAFRDAAARLSYAFFPTAAFLFAVAPEFITALFGKRFLPAVPLFRISVVGVVLAVLPMDGVLRARGHTRHLFLSYLTKALVTAPLLVFGVKWLGMKGGLLSWAIAEAVGKGTLLWKVPEALSPSTHRVPLRAVIPWSAFARAAAAAGLAAAAVFWFQAGSHRVLAAQATLPATFAGRALPLALAGLIFLLTYLVGLCFTGVRPWQHLEFLRRWPKAAEPPASSS